MALLTAGTTATTSLRALTWQPGGMTIADVATLNAALKEDTAVANSKENVPDSTTQYFPRFDQAKGLVTLPSNRGVIRMYPGDFILYDPATGFPFVVSGTAMANNPQWVHS